MDAKLSFIQLVSIYATVAGGTTPVVIAIIRWFQERSRAAKRIKNLSYAIKLREFLDPENGIAEVLGTRKGGVVSVEFARSELQRVLGELSEGKKTVSRKRKFFLIYRPAGVRAWIAHILFFAAIAFPLIALTGEYFDNSLGEDISAIFNCAPFVVCMMLIFHAWASFERRQSEGEVLVSKAMGPLTYYPANNVFGLLAHVMFYLGILHVVDMFTPPINLYEIKAIPLWFGSTSYLAFSTFLPVAYFWASVEYAGKARSLGWLKWEELRRITSRKLSPEQFAVFCFLGLGSVNK
jgi:hypothetical protein